jgi:hypothetical protein
MGRSLHGEGRLGVVPDGRGDGEGRIDEAGCVVPDERGGGEGRGGRLSGSSRTALSGRVELQAAFEC